MTMMPMTHGRAMLLSGCLSAALAGCAGVDHKHEQSERTSAHEPPVEIEGCYTITRVQGGSPHAEGRDQFCVEEVAGTFYLYPGIGMEDWGSQGIELMRVGSSNNFRFVVTVDPHQTGVDHGARHDAFQINILPGGKARITGIGVSSTLHGGTAHSLQ